MFGLSFDNRCGIEWEPWGDHRVAHPNTATSPATSTRGGTRGGW